jgi:hypothetical protein
MQNTQDEEQKDFIAILNGTFDDACIRRHKNNATSSGGGMLDWFCFNKNLLLI